MEDDPPFTLADSWAHLGNVLRIALNVFGWPAMLAAQLFMRRKDRQDLLKWLAPLEAYARRLLVIEALALPARNDPPEFHAKGRIVSAMRDAPAPDLPEDTAQWRVRFVAWRGDPRCKASAAPVLQVRRQPNFTVLALARRLEALRRLVENHDRDVVRLARKIATNRAEAEYRFPRYRYSAGPVDGPLAQAQREMEIAFATNTS